MAREYGGSREGGQGSEEEEGGGGEAEDEQGHSWRSHLVDAVHIGGGRRGIVGFGCSKEFRRQAGIRHKVPWPSGRQKLVLEIAVRVGSEERGRDPIRGGLRE